MGRPPLLSLLLVWVVTGCATSRVATYADLLEPRVGHSHRIDIDRLLGSPAVCVAWNDAQLRCEYRTAAGKNGVIPAVFHKEPGYLIDLSPYEYFDVLDVYFDRHDRLARWEPVVLID